MIPRDRSPVRTSPPRQPSGKKTLEPVEPLQSDLAAVGENYRFVWPEENIDTLHKEGKPQTFIAKEAGCSQSAVSKHANRKLCKEKVWKKKMHNQLRETQP